MSQLGSAPFFIHVVVHRQRALKALDERLKKSSEPMSWPSLDEAGSSSQDDATPSQAATPSGPMQLEAVVVEKDPSKGKTDPSPKPLTHEQAARVETV